MLCGCAKKYRAADARTPPIDGAMLAKVSAMADLLLLLALLVLLSELERLGTDEDGTQGPD
jgi:hypothetical protein